MKKLTVTNVAPWLTIKDQEDGPVEILIYDQIGKDWFDGSGTNAKDFAATLKSIPENRDIIVGINSPGGNVWDGLAIFHMLAARANRVTTRIDGVAASISSVIFQAGSKRIMPKNALQMCHRASGLTAGNAEDMRKMADALDAHDAVIAGVYADRTGMDRKKVEKMMEDETWMTGDDCASNGFCSEVTASVAMDASANAFDLSRFRNVPGVSNRSGDAAKPEGNKMETPTATAPAAAPVASPAAAPTNIITMTREDLDKVAADAASAAIRDFLPRDGAPPVSPGRVSDQGNPLIEAYNKMSPGPDRLAFAVQNFEPLTRQRIKHAPQGTNTVSSSLYPNIAVDSAIEVLRNRLAMLNMFTQAYSLTPMAPLVPIVLTANTAGPTVQTNATDFTSGDSTLAPITITPARLTATVHLTDAQMNYGIQMKALGYQQAGKLADAMNDVVTALMTTATFGAAITIGAAANLDATDLAPVLAAAKNYGRKNLLLDGGHMAYLLPTNRESFAFGEKGAYGFDAIVENNRWTGATTNTVGFVCSPSAIVVASGVSRDVPTAQFESISTAQLPNGMGVRHWVWFDPNTQIRYSMLDILFGAAVADATAGELLITS